MSIESTKIQRSRLRQPPRCPPSEQRLVLLVASGGRGKTALLARGLDPLAPGHGTGPCWRGYFARRRN